MEDVGIFELYTLLLFVALLRLFLFVCVFRVVAIIPNSVACSRKKEPWNNEKPERFGPGYMQKPRWGGSGFPEFS